MNLGQFFNTRPTRLNDGQVMVRESNDRTFDENGVGEAEGAVDDPQDDTLPPTEDGDGRVNTNEVAGLGFHAFTSVTRYWYRVK